MTTVPSTAESILRYAGQGLQQTPEVGDLLGFLRIRRDELQSVAVSRPIAYDPANSNRESGEGWREFDGNFPSDFQLDTGCHGHAAFVEFVSTAIVQLGPFRSMDNDPDRNIESMARPPPCVKQGARLYRFVDDGGGGSLERVFRQRASLAKDRNEAHAPERSKSIVSLPPTTPQ